MALLTANGIGVLDGSTISMPLVGAWIADLIVDQPSGAGFEAGTKVKIVATNGVTLAGVVDPSRTGSYLDAIHVRVIGGAGGMAKTVSARGYAQPSAFVRDVLASLAADAGETLSSAIDGGLLGTNIVAWATAAVLANHALVTLIDFAIPGANWRILSDGTLWVGSETWPTSAPEFILLTNDPKEGTFDLGVDSPSIEPGVTIDGIGRINKVEHALEKKGIRTRVWIELGEQEDRGIRAALTDIVKQATNGIDYLGLYHCRIAVQSADLKTVDIQPNNSKIPGLQGVPIEWGTPGITAQIVSGNCLLGWSGGDPSKPYALCFDGFSTTFINVGENAAPTEFALKGFTYRTQQTVLDTALTVFTTAFQTFVTAFMSDPATPGVLPATFTALGVFVPTVATYLSAVAAFEAQSATYLSTKVRVE